MGLAKKLMGGGASKQAVVLITGLENAGKSAIMHQMATGQCVHTTPTVGCDISEVIKYDVRLNFWDLGGDPKTRELWRHHYVCSDAIIFVVDSTDHGRMAEANQVMHDMLEAAQDDMEGAPLVVMCNKQDIDGAMPAQSIAEKFDLENRVKDRYYYCQACSGRTGEGIEEALYWLTKTL